MPTSIDYRFADFLEPSTDVRPRPMAWDEPFSALPTFAASQSAAPEENASSDYLSHVVPRWLAKLDTPLEVGGHLRAQPDVRFANADVYFKPVVTRQWHALVRQATAYEHASIERRLEEKTRSLSSASLADMLKLLRGRAPRRSPDAGRTRAREHSLLHELTALLNAAAGVAPVGAVARRGHDLLTTALRRARSLSRAARPLPPETVGLLAGSTAANALLGSEIMRHGPPAPCLVRIRPGAG
jgi:hypothetical protein